MSNRSFGETPKKIDSIILGILPNSMVQIGQHGTAWSSLLHKGDQTSFWPPERLSENEKGHVKVFTRYPDEG